MNTPERLHGLLWESTSSNRRWRAAATGRRIRLDFCPGREMLGLDLRQVKQKNEVCYAPRHKLRRRSPTAVVDRRSTLQIILLRTKTRRTYHPEPYAVILSGAKDLQFLSEANKCRFFAALRMTDFQESTCRPFAPLRAGPKGRRYTSACCRMAKSPGFHAWAIM